MASPEKEIENNILSTFSGVANAIGYSPLHGKIIGVLIANSKPICLHDLADKTGYSLSMVSLSLDFLEVLGVIRKVKKEADRKLYVALGGDLLECLKRAIIIKLEKSIRDSLVGFEESKKQLGKLSGEDKERVLKTL